MDGLTQAAQFILSLSILVILHELGHFIPAKLFKTRVEKFYLFFDPWFSLFKFKRGETEYGIGWLPLGGYVKISGMIDESMDKEQMKLPPQEWEFRSKPAWQRLIIMLGGVTVNVILGVLIYMMILFVWGEKYLPTANAKYGIYCDTLALELGLQNGDKIISVDNKVVAEFDDIPKEIILNNAKTLQILRNDSITKEIIIPETFISKVIKGKDLFIDIGFPCIIDSVLPGKPAEKSGLLKGDQIVSINNIETPFYMNVTKFLKENKGKNITVKINRSGEIKSIETEVTTEGMLGFKPKNPTDFFEFETKKYGLVESLSAGINKGYETFEGYIKQLKIIFTVKDAHEGIGGFITIGKAFDTSWNWKGFWAFTAFFSIVLAIMNILPIPALDGGHVMFLLYEVFTGRTPNEKFMEYAQYAGMIILLTLMLYANGNDVMRLFQ